MASSRLCSFAKKRRIPLEVMKVAYAVRAAFIVVVSVRFERPKELSQQNAFRILCMASDSFS